MESQTEQTCGSPETANTRPDTEPSSLRPEDQVPSKTLSRRRAQISRRCLTRFGRKPATRADEAANIMDHHCVFAEQTTTQAHALTRSTVSRSRLALSDGPSSTGHRCLHPQTISKPSTGLDHPLRHPLRNGIRLSSRLSAAHLRAISHTLARKTALRGFREHTNEEKILPHRGRPEHTSRFFTRQGTFGKNRANASSAANLDP
jgi:hypothetical protein